MILEKYHTNVYLYHTNVYDIYGTDGINIIVYSNDEGTHEFYLATPPPPPPQGLTEKYSVLSISETWLTFVHVLQAQK